MSIFVINGLPGAGKTTFGEVAGAKLEAMGIRSAHLSSIEPIKMILKPEADWDSAVLSEDHWKLMRPLKQELNLGGRDWDGETKDDLWRGKMSDLKAAITRDYPRFLDNWVLDKARALGNKGVSFVDIREPDNIAAFVHFCSEHEVVAKSVCILSDAGRESVNPSDNPAILDYPYDITIENNHLGVEDKIGMRNLEILAEGFIAEHIVKPRGVEKSG